MTIECTLAVIYTGVNPETGNHLIEARIGDAPEVDTPAGRIVPDRVEAAFRDGEMRWLLLAGTSVADRRLRGGWTFHDVSDPFVAGLAVRLGRLR